VKDDEWRRDLPVETDPETIAGALDPCIAKTVTKRIG
jgi:hypothetical protein